MVVIAVHITDRTEGNRRSFQTALQLYRGRKISKILTDTSCKLTLSRHK